MKGKEQKRSGDRALKSGILDDVRQWCFPPEFRIARPTEQMLVAETASCTPSQSVGGPTRPAGGRESDELVADMATCLWYLKTKYFSRPWDDDGNGDNEPRVRRALGRLNKGKEALAAGGIEVNDPTNERYPQGGEGLMRPIQFQPTAGLTFEKVAETVAPIIYRNGQLIQRGEVFVAVPEQDGFRQPAQGVGTATTGTHPEDVADEYAPPSGKEDEPDSHARANSRSAEIASATGGEAKTSERPGGVGGEELTVLGKYEQPRDAASSSDHPPAATDAASGTERPEDEEGPGQETKTRGD